MDRIVRRDVIKFLSALAVFCAVPIGLFLVHFDRRDAMAPEILSDMEAIVEGRTPDKVFSKFDLICFDLHDSSPKDDFNKPLAAKNVGIEISLQSCGIDRSCCPMVSETEGMVGLVKGNEIRCVEISQTFLSNPPRAICERPQDLILTKKVFDKSQVLPFRAGMSTPGRPYFEVSVK